MQELSIHLKRLGKKKIYSETITVNNEINNLKTLISACVASKVKQFNDTREDNKLLSFLTPSQIQEQSETGKIGFDAIENFNKANTEESINTAIQAFKDGMFLVFINDDEITSLEEAITLTPDKTITFLRMTFLTGTYW